MPANASALSDSPDCHYSDDIYQSDLALMAHKPPTRFNLMTSRYREIVQAARGYKCTGTTTVAFDGHDYFQAGLSDDPGIAELIPSIASWTDLPLGRSFDLIEGLLIALGVLSGYAGYWRLCPHTRWVGLAVFLAIGLLEAKVADVYSLQLSPLLAGIPWIAYFALTKSTFAFGLCAALLVFLCSMCSFLRSGTLLICLAFTVTVVFGGFAFRKALVLLLVVVLSCAPSLWLAHRLIANRNTVLAKFGEGPTGVNSHPIWHSIYLGLGFVPNSEVSAFRDELAADRVRSIDPTAAYTSAKYEAILRNEVLRIAKQNPIVLIENLAVKSGLVSILVFILLYPSRKKVFSQKSDLWMDLAFSLAIVLSASGAVLVAPLTPYLLTFLGMTALFSSVSYCRRNRSKTSLEYGRT